MGLPLNYGIFREEAVEWLKEVPKDNHPFDPERFEPGEVRFDNPKKRWFTVFGGRR